MKTRLAFSLFFVCVLFHSSYGQVVILHGGGHGSHDDPKLHVDPKWRECSFQLDPGLTQESFSEFTKEAGLVIAFRPLVDAKPMGARNFEISVVQWSTAIDEGKDAWNDTFVHPDSAHWLVGGPRLPIMGLTARMGITNKLDAGVYLTKNPGANYGFYGGQLQYNILNNDRLKWSTSLRGSFVKMFGPDDLSLNVYTADVVTSKEFVVQDQWLTVSPYVVVSTYLSTAHEKSDVVNLEDTRKGGVQMGAGVVAKVKFARLAVEYNQAEVNTVSMKVGVGF